MGETWANLSWQNVVVILAGLATFAYLARSLSEIWLERERRKTLKLEIDSKLEPRVPDRPRELIEQATPTTRE